MALIVLASAGGAPGVTTTAVGLAVGWPRSVLLVDADPAASQAVLAGYLRGTSPRGKGLIRVAEAYRERRSLVEAVIDQSIELTDGGSARRLLLPGFQRPANSLLFTPVWSELAPVLRGLEQQEIDVVVDAGRLDPRGLPPALVEGATSTVLVTRTSLRSVAAARTSLPIVVDQTRGLGVAGPQLVLVGPGQPYGRREIGAALECPVLAELPDDPGAAAVFSDGARPAKQHDRSALVRSLHQLGEEIMSRTAVSAKRIGVPS